MGGLDPFGIGSTPIFLTNSLSSSSRTSDFESEDCGANPYEGAKTYCGLMVRRCSVKADILGSNPSDRA